MKKRNKEQENADDFQELSSSSWKKRREEKKLKKLAKKAAKSGLDQSQANNQDQNQDIVENYREEDVEAVEEKKESLNKEATLINSDEKGLEIKESEKTSEEKTLETLETSETIIEKTSEKTTEKSSVEDKKKKSETKEKSKQQGNKAGGLSPQEQKRLKELKKKRSELTSNKPNSAQKTIPYETMYQDGLCKVRDNYYSKTIQFYDVNYQLARQSEQENIFDLYMQFLNYFDPSVSVQLTFFNQKRSYDESVKNIDIPLRGDRFDDLRTDFSSILKNQMAKGNNGLQKTKYITIGTECKSVKEARSKLESIENAVMSNFKLIGAASNSMTGTERLAQMHDFFNGDTLEKFRFSFEDMGKSGLSTKDYIAPSGFDFRPNDYFMMGKSYAKVTFLQMFAEEFRDQMLADILNIDDNIVVNIHIKSVDHVKAIKQIKGKLSDVQKMKIDSQKQAVRSGYDMDILPPDIESYSTDAQYFLESLTTANMNMFNVTVLILNTAPTKKKLDNIVANVSGIVQKYNLNIKPMMHLQEKGMVASLPLGINDTKISRALLTNSVAIFVPFTTQEIFMGGEAFYYGLNTLSNNMIMADRKKLKNPNGLILGTPGSGKSFAAKREMVSCMTNSDDDIIICDPEGEYYPLVNAVDGQMIKISSKSSDYINPLDVNLDIVYHPEKYRIDGDVEDIETIIADKSEFLISFVELVMKKPRGEELTGDEVAIIDKCTQEIYNEYLYNDPVEEKMPTLSDLYNKFVEYSEVNEAAANIASALIMYVDGSQNVFNHRTNVDMNNRVVCFNIKELGTTLKKVGMLVIQNMVWTRVSKNRALKKSTRYYVDEFHLLLKQPQTAAYSVEIWKRFRKWGGIPTGITQNVGDLLISREVENIFGNSDFVLMLNQSSDDQEILAHKLNISPNQLSYVRNANAGEGLISYNGIIIPFQDRFPKENKIYKLLTTKLEET